MVDQLWEVEPSGEAMFGPCECCGQQTRRVWGYVHRAQTVAAYFVEWSPGAVGRHDPCFDLVIGSWGDGTDSADRQVVALVFRRIDGAPQFMVTDAVERPSVADRALRRNQVIGRPIAQFAFAVVDQIWLHDDRIGELTLAPRRPS